MKTLILLIMLLIATNCNPVDVMANEKYSIIIYVIPFSGNNTIIYKTTAKKVMFDSYMAKSPWLRGFYVKEFDAYKATIRYSTLEFDGKKLNWKAKGTSYNNYPFLIDHTFRLGDVAWGILKPLKKVENSFVNIFVD